MAVSYESKRCNVVVVGVMGAGKSTLANKILRHDIFDIGSKPTRATDTVSCGERVIEGPGKIMYSVKVVDTMGFADPRGHPDDVVKAIAEFFQKKVVEGVSLVLFVVSGNRVTEEVIKTIERVKKDFREISSMSALVITHCETWSDETREKYVKDLKSSKDPDVASIVAFMQKGIITVGFPDLEESKPKVRSVYEEDMETDVLALHQLIYESTEMRLTGDMFRDEKFWDKVKQSEVCLPPSAADTSAKAQQRPWCSIL